MQTGQTSLCYRFVDDMGLDQLYLTATGFEPYDFQRRVAEAGLPELLRIPTGCGKTEAVGLGWLYRRRFHADAEVRAAAPRWLVIALPTRTLVEQTVDRFGGWLELLRLKRDVGLHMVQGGVSWSDRDWRLAPDRDAVFVGTVDMLLSRAFNRGYADSRWCWPMSFGGFNKRGSGPPRVPPGQPEMGLPPSETCGLDVSIWVVRR